MLFSNNRTNLAQVDSFLHRPGRLSKDFQAETLGRALMMWMRVSRHLDRPRESPRAWLLDPCSGAASGFPSKPRRFEALS
jgi:hypothetical protein